ncbi:aspartate/glutamate racemase family protein [Photobacterium andalusiense]|uniref:Aspartate racemase n=1 Tax=Photobacterium andalusiense TaxID=2204296 RepID=A0A1Y6MAH0_9GAMM|nr:aspartate/glutamate racemase family protein [Photobacterium andalusiense]SMY33567.1 Aspartate racemase [Photobacterium andalusiense]
MKITDNLHSPRIGIIGGMGNEAMVDLMLKMASLPTHSDYQFVAFGNSRLAYKPQEVMQQWLPTDIPELRKYDTAAYTLRLMQYLAVDQLGLACNSAHELFRRILPEIPVTFVDMIQQTATSLQGCQESVLVMGVNSLIESKLYQTALTEQGIKAKQPSVDNQAKIMEAIYNPNFGIKTAQITNQAETLLCEVICDEIAKQGCTKVILGCTELPLALTANSCQRFKAQGMLPENVEVIDASMALAQALMLIQGQSDALIQPLATYQRQYLDWAQPLAFKVSSLAEAIEIQQRIFDYTVDYLTERSQSLVGSYFHLPTLFFSASAIDVEQKLVELEIDVYSDINVLDKIISEKLGDYYSDF